jgi:radical SAM superfamily enzyme YgiQ (UPF0313 family)
MTDIILVHPKAQEKEPLYAPLAHLALAAYIQKEYSVTIVDTRIEENYKNKIKKLLQKNPIAVGITSLTGEQIKHGLEIGKFVKKENPNIPIIWGGVHVTFFPVQSLQSPFVDIVVKGEGEKTLYETLKAIENDKDLRDIAGIAYKENSRIHDNKERKFLNMDELPMPAWHLIDVESYIERLSTKSNRRININTSRGCPHRCAFCYNQFFNKGIWRGKSSSLVVDELKFLVEKYKIDEIIFHDDNFPANKKRAIKIAHGIKKEKLDLKWYINMRADYFKREYLRELMKGGLAGLRVGAESGSQRILNMIHKNITISQIMDSALISKEFNLDVSYSFVQGWPSETMEERKKTIALAFQLQKIYPKVFIFPLWIYTPYPGAPLYFEAIKRGFSPPSSLEEWGEFNWGISHLPWIKNSKKIEAIHVMSEFAFYNKNLKMIIKDTKDVGLKRTIMRLGTYSLKPWSKFRLTTDFWLFPYEYLLFKKIRKKISS